MKVRLILSSLIILLLFGGKKSDLMTLKIINKSGQELYIQMTTEDRSGFYYLHVPMGDRENPLEKTFTIVKKTYRMRIYYTEVNDPTTGYECHGEHTSTLYASRNIRITVTSCDQLPRYRGEPTMIKWGAWRYIF